MSTLRRQMDRLFDESFPLRFWSTSGTGNGTNYFPVDVLDAGDNVVIEASLPGVKPEDIDISVTGQTVTLKGESKQEHEHKAENFVRHERTHGAFIRQITLPTEVDANKAEAAYENGLLCLTLPKAESVKPKTIKVEAKPVLEARKS